MLMTHGFIFVFATGRAMTGGARVFVTMTSCKTFLVIRYFYTLLYDQLVLTLYNHSSSSNSSSFTEITSFIHPHASLTIHMNIHNWSRKNILTNKIHERSSYERTRCDRARANWSASFNRGSKSNSEPLLLKNPTSTHTPYHGYMSDRHARTTHITKARVREEHSPRPIFGWEHNWVRNICVCE